MAESIHEKLKRVRKPHVHITMDIDGDGLPVHEIPFVMGVMGDFVGKPDESNPPKPLSERKFIEIDRDNFDEVMARMNPGVDIKVKDTLSGDENSEMRVALRFKSMEDFHPDNLVKNIPALKKLLDARGKLEQLASAAERGKNAEQLLEEILQNTEKLQQLKAEVDSQGGESQ